MKKPRLPENDDGLVVQEAKPITKRPSLYKVILMNDDYTPMEFVVLVLETYFALDREKATQVMLNVHMQGKGLCGVFTKEIAEHFNCSAANITKEIAETKVNLVNDFSRENQHPLMCSMESA